jgi:hypothetical protein
MKTPAWTRPLGPALAALALHAAFMAAYLAAPRFGGDVSALVCVDQRLAGAWPFENIRVGFESGYDGQYSYALARNPWRVHESAFVAPPAYRHLRLLYPALCWLLSGGHPVVLLWVMPVVNLLAIAGLAWLGTDFALRCGRTPWWGFLLPLMTLACLPALRNLTDAAATLCAFGLLVAWLRKWHPAWLATWAAAALFAREQNLAIVAIVPVLAVWERDWKRATALIPGCILWAGWVAVLHAWYGESPFVMGNFGHPFQGFLRRWQSPFDRAGRIPTHGLAMAWLTVQLLLCLALPLFRCERATMLVGLAGAALTVFGSWAIYEHWYGYLRVFVWMPLAIWSWAVQSGRSWPAWLTLLALPWPLLAIAMGWR